MASLRSDVPHGLNGLLAAPACAAIRPALRAVLHDAIEAVGLPVIEVHISNVRGREEFRHHSWISPVARGIIIGLGIHGYPLAIRALHLLSGPG